MKSKFLFALLFLASSFTLFSQSVDKPTVFTGGMFLHTGFLQNSRSAEPINGLCSGIGGQGFFHLGKHFRLGSEGYGSTFRYGKNPGYYKMGWGGVLTGYQWRVGRFKPMISLTIGGGKVHDLYLIDGDVNDNLPDQTVYRVYSHMLTVPALSLHYALKKKINLAFKADFALPVGAGKEGNFTYGPRFYLGVLFNK
jgi:hypothetical protein